MVYFVAKAVEERRQAGGGAWVTGNQLAQSEGGFEFRGFNQVSRSACYRIRLISQNSSHSLQYLFPIFLIVSLDALIVPTCFHCVSRCTVPRSCL